jgi:hypothetical protein
MGRRRRYHDRRTDYVDFFFTEETAFSGMRIEAGDGDARVGDAERLRSRMG